jgi:23S rRNA pseudouridine1911/1915/1917 synthase
VSGTMGQEMAKLTFEVPQSANKSRLDDYLFGELTTLSRMYLRVLIKTGQCEVNGAIENSGYRLRTNDFIEVAADVSRGTANVAQEIPLEIIYEDGDLIVINKPAGMLVHPTHREKTGTLLNGLTFYLNGGGKRPPSHHLVTRNRVPLLLGQEESQNGTPNGGTPNGKFIRPGLPHRLDKQTSGLIVVAKTPLAHRRLAMDFMKKRVQKRYLALVEGVIEQDEGIIEAPIGRYAEHKYWSVKQDGKHSETRFWVCERYDETTLVELEPVTGRTNQLRIHCEMIGHPIIGDVKRGGREFDRLCLHAWRLALKHPTSGELLEFESEISFDKASEA